MTLREPELLYPEVGAGPTPEMLVIVSSPADATALGALMGLDDSVTTTLVATGPDPMAVDEVLDDQGTPAGRILVTDELGPGPAHEVAGLLPRIDDMVAHAAPVAIVVRGGTSAALAAAQVAAWRGVPVIALAASPGSRTEAANQAAVAELATWQGSAGGTPFPTRLELAVHRRTDALAGVIGGPTGVPAPRAASELSA